MTSKDAIYRELRYAALADLVAGDHIKLNKRRTVSRDSSDYPWVIFRRSLLTENNVVHLVADQFEIEIIGIRASSTVGDDKLEVIRETLIDHFAGKHKTWGQFQADGTPDSTTGLRMRCRYNGMREGYSSDLYEKSHILTFSFTFVRQ